MKAELIFTGSELLLGHILNSHAQFLGLRLSGMGIEVTLHTTVGDEQESLECVLRQAMTRADLIIITGGLGPTTDDITVETLAGVLGLSLVLHEESLAKIKERYQERGLEMTKSILKQVYVPEDAMILPNSTGTAPGALIERGSQVIVALPGPPNELIPMFEKQVAPFLSGKIAGGAITSYKVFKLTGITESAVQDLIYDLGGQGNPGIAYVAKPGEIQVRLTARATSPVLAEKMLAKLSLEIKSRLSNYIFSSDDEILEETIGKLLLARGLSIGVAESCTGGMVAARITDIPGSSGYFMGGVVSYSNDVKNKVLGVSAGVLERYGAVSREVASAMAEGVRKLTGADLGLATTGIAGPGGGTPDKPRGLVYISMADASSACSREYRFPGIRAAVRLGVTNAALNMLKLYIMDKRDQR